MCDSETTIQQTDPLEQALAELELAKEKGESLDLNEFLARHAEVADQLQTMIDFRDQMEEIVGSVRQAFQGLKVEGYEILELLGEGGMGIVYKARQTGTEQVVALKMLRPDRDMQPHVVQQFRDEVRAAAKLRHPNRVRIFHFGDANGQPYYAMELIEGCSLAEKMKQPGGVSKESALRYLASIAEAVAEAHDKGILHRDLKPHNILIDEHTDEALLTDFGLAIFDSDTSNGKGQIAGTIPYMSPEATDTTKAVDRSNDIYGLGATLYHVLVGQPPFQGATQSELIKKIRQEQPKPMRNVPRKMEAICLKCLRKEPKDRYSSATEFAKALRNYLHRVHYARNLTSGAWLYIAIGPAFFAIHFLVFFLIRGQAWEPVIWVTLFCMYIPAYVTFALSPVRTSIQDHYRSIVDMYTIWGGKLIAAIFVSIAFRCVFTDDPYKAILLTYPVFGSMSAMALFTFLAKMPRWTITLAVSLCLMTVFMGMYLEYAPLIYGIVGGICVSVYGLLLRNLGKELS